ncbi:hypothetical protein KC323_g5700 [Hortaea werneckii]|nr:hypothetical protein KC323_g5700 [Hortaea werneckii]
MTGRKRPISPLTREADDDIWGPSGENKRFKRTSTLPSPSDDQDELRLATFERTSRFRGTGGGFVSRGRYAEAKSIPAAVNAAPPFPPGNKTTTMGSAAFASGVKGSSGLASRTSRPFLAGSSRHAARTTAQGKSAGFPFVVDDDSSSSSEDELEEVDVEGDEGSTSLRSPSVPHATKSSTGLFQGFSGDVAGRQGSRDEVFRRKQDQRIESERLRRHALSRRKLDGASGLGFGDLGAVEEGEELDVSMDEGKDVKTKVDDGAVLDRSGREAEVITLSDSDDEDDVIAVATVPSGPSSMAGPPDGGNTKILNDEIKPDQESNEPEKPLHSAEEARYRHDTALQEKPNSSTIQSGGATPPKTITGSTSPSHHSSRLPNFSPPPRKLSALEDATERIRQERLENAKRIWQRTQARAQAEAEKARQREARARAEDVHRSPLYSDSNPDVLRRSDRPDSLSRNGGVESERREVHEDQQGEVRQDKATPGKQEEGTLPQAAGPEINKPNTWQNPDNKPQKEDARKESLIEQPSTDNPRVEDLAKQRKDRQVALVREAEQKLALEAAKKAESERQMAAYKNSMNSRLADAATHSKQVSGFEAERDRPEDVRTIFERDDRKNSTVEVGKQDVSTRRIEDEQNSGIENAQHAVRHSPNGDLRDRQRSLGGASRNDRGQEKEDGPMSLTSPAKIERLAAAGIPQEPLQTYGQTAFTSTINHQGLSHRPTSLKAMAEQGGTITRVKSAQPEPLQLQIPKKSHVPRIEILPEDIKLFFWRDAGNEWQDIIEDFEEATGRKKCEETLRKRYRQVKEALEGVGASRELLTRVGTGDAKAKSELDALIPQAPISAEKLPNVEIKAGIKASSKEQLGELTPQDIRLLVSRGKGMLWSQIVQDFAISTGENVSEPLLRVRYKLVKEAIEKSEVDASLLTQVMAGDDTAREKLNRLVHGVWPVPCVETERKVGRPCKESSHDRQLGHVSADDAKIVRWKEEGMTGAEMVEALRQTTGKSLAIKAILKRCRKVRGLLEAAGVYADRGLLDAVANGDQEACSRLNQLIHSTVTASHVGEILPEDVMMVQEKQSGTTYENIVSTYRRRTRGNRSFSWVYERCKAVKALLDGLDIDTRLLESVASGNREARRRLNSLVHGKWPLYASTSSTGSSETPVERLETPFQTRTRFPESASHTQQLKPAFSMGSAYSSSYGSREDQNVSTPPTSPGSFVPQPVAVESRPTTAGKQMNEAAFRYYLEEIREERLREEDSDTDSDEEEEGDQFSPEDICHFIYQVERREITNSEEDTTIDEKNWITYGEPLTDRIKATAIASKQALVAHDRQLNDAIHAGNDWSLNRQTFNSGILYTLDSPAAGTVQVRVQEYQRSFQEQIRPSDSVAWVNRTTYTIMQRRTQTARSTNTVSVTEKEVDPILDEETDLTTEKEVLTLHETQKQKVVGDFVYTTPDLANDAAMRHLIAKTYRPTTINLTVRDVERADLMREFREKYEGRGGEDILLFREMVEEEDGNSLEVWVQETRLKGPRNV